MLTFELVVSAGGPISSPAFVNVTVNPIPAPANRPPTANAGADQAVNPGATVVLDGSASSDPDGDQISFSWRQTAGPTITLQGASTANPSFNAPAVTTQTVLTVLTFELRVSDGSLQSAPATVHVVIDQSGQIFNTPIKLSGDMVISNSDSPKIAVSGNNVYATWIGDRKSTRLNSSHGYISYAVFCLKKKNRSTGWSPTSPPGSNGRPGALS